MISKIDGKRNRNEMVVEFDGVYIDRETVKNYICKDATDKEIYMFLQICKYQKLNPFLREIYLVKYGDKGAQAVTSKEAFLKRAVKNPKYRGHKVSIGHDGDEMTATAQVFVDGYLNPIEVTVYFSEYVGINHFWKNKPRTMLCKVALVQALREAFPDDFAGLYDQSEINTIPDELPSAPIQINNKKEETITGEEVEKISDWKDAKVPFGKNEGVRLGDLSENQIRWYYDKSKKAEFPNPHFVNMLEKSISDIESINDSLSKESV